MGAGVATSPHYPVPFRRGLKVRLAFPGDRWPPRRLPDPGSGRGIAAPVGSGSEFPSKRASTGFLFGKSHQSRSFDGVPRIAFENIAARPAIRRVPFEGIAASSGSLFGRPPKRALAGSLPRFRRPEASVPRGRSFGKWDRLAPHASSLVRPNRLGLRRRLRPGASFLIGLSPGPATAPGHTSKLSPFSSRTKRNQPVDK